MNKLVNAVDKYSWINNDVHTRKTPSIGNNENAEIKDIIVIWFRTTVAFFGGVGKAKIYDYYFQRFNLLHNCTALGSHKPFDEI